MSTPISTDRAFVITVLSIFRLYLGGKSPRVYANQITVLSKRNLYECTVQMPISVYTLDGYFEFISSFLIEDP